MKRTEELDEDEIVGDVEDVVLGFGGAMIGATLELVQTGVVTIYEFN